MNKILSKFGFSWFKHYEGQERAAGWFEKVSALSFGIGAFSYDKPFAIIVFALIVCLVSGGLSMWLTDKIKKEKDF